MANLIKMANGIHLVPKQFNPYRFIFINREDVDDITANSKMSPLFNLVYPLVTIGDQFF